MVPALEYIYMYKAFVSVTLGNLFPPWNDKTLLGGLHIFISWAQGNIVEREHCGRLCFLVSVNQYFHGILERVAKLQGRRGSHLGSTRHEWAIGLINYNGVGHIVHDDVLECHVGCFTAIWRVSPCLDPDAVCSPCHGAIFNHKPTYIFFIRIFSQASNTEIWNQMSNITA